MLAARRVPRALAAEVAPGAGPPPLPAEAVAPIRRLATASPPRGAGRLRGERPQPGFRVAGRAVRADRPGPRAPILRGQTCAAFFGNHTGAIRACDFLPVTGILFRPLFAFFVVGLATRRVIHGGATRHPTIAWVAQQLRGATLIARSG